MTLLNQSHQSTEHFFKTIKIRDCEGDPGLAFRAKNLKGKLVFSLVLVAEFSFNKIK